ncbi:DJ-1/PfpI family protein [Pseudonocardia sp. TRM90224]|uniref:DJ-1/PfpI family protein n=1 Tax=Pseudonocardia sp. TRM90224 TaxID=2812678 RepID=UPI001E3A4977|nr:DJ-1/PfpI family protein [Pseudonocardia sp. TRM90224]
MPQPLTVGILVAPEYAVCDIVGPQTVLGIQPGTELHLLWKDRTTVNGYPTFPTTPTTTFADCPDELDVLAVGAIPPHVVADPEVVAFFRAAADRAKHVIAVCGGVVLAGAAGLLVGRRATTNFHILDLLPEFGAIPVEGGEVVRDGKIWTAGPATGSYEAALMVLAELRGEQAARQAELDIEYAPHPPFGTGSPALAGPEMTKASTERMFAILNLDPTAPLLDQLHTAKATA